jgi:hypothetical protein
MARVLSSTTFPRTEAQLIAFIESTFEKLTGSLPIANSETAKKGMAGRNPPLMLLPAKFGPIRDSPGAHGRFLLLALAENILPPLLGNHRRE